MLYKGIDIHNIGEIVPYDDGISWLRVPQRVYDSLESEQGKWMCRGSTGVELRFVIRDGPVKLTLRSLSSPSVLTTFHVFYGGIQGGWECHELDKHVPNTPTIFQIVKPLNMETLQRVSEQAGFDWNPDVVRVIFDRGEYRLMDIEGNVTPPGVGQTPSKTLLTYGSSITHGSNALAASHSWASVLAHQLNMDLMNLGMAGSCLMEPEMMEYIAALGESDRWHVSILELGINAIHWQDSMIRNRVLHAIEQVAGRNPEKPVILISPLYCVDDFHNAGHAQRWRDLMAEVVQEKNYANVMLINGLDLLDTMSLLSADEVHPSIYGVQRIAVKLETAVARFVREFHRNRGDLRR